MAFSRKREKPIDSISPKKVKIIVLFSFYRIFIGLKYIVHTILQTWLLQERKFWSTQTFGDSTINFNGSEINQAIVKSRVYIKCLGSLLFNIACDFWTDNKPI